MYSSEKMSIYSFHCEYILSTVYMVFLTNLSIKLHSTAIPYVHSILRSFQFFFCVSISFHTSTHTGWIFGRRTAIFNYWHLLVKIACETGLHTSKSVIKKLKQKHILAAVYICVCARARVHACAHMCMLWPIAVCLACGCLIFIWT